MRFGGWSGSRATAQGRDVDLAPRGWGVAAGEDGPADAPHGRVPASMISSQREGVPPRRAGATFPSRDRGRPGTVKVPQRDFQASFRKGGAAHAAPSARDTVLRSRAPAWKNSCTQTLLGRGVPPGRP